MVSHEEYLALGEGAGVIDRRHRGRLRLTGADRRSYLQGLLTNDIAALTPGTGCYAALLTAQGRMLSDMRVMETGDEVLMDLPGAVAARVHDHLANFIFSEDVSVVDVGAALAQWGVYGPASAATVARVLDGVSGASELDAMPMFANFGSTFRGLPVTVVRSDEVGVAGFDLFVDASLGAAVVDAIEASGALEVGQEAAEIRRVEAGRPLFGVDMDEDTIPLEAGITDRAISLTKGCYVGQEIIIRVLHRGHGRVARRLVGLKLQSSAVPSRGASVTAAGREIGRITSAVYSPRAGAAIALGYVHRDFTEPGTRVDVGGTADAQAAVVVEPPFA